jgi:hypothetical protein
VGAISAVVAGLVGPGAVCGMVLVQAVPTTARMTTNATRWFKDSTVVGRSRMAAWFPVLESAR